MSVQTLCLEPDPILRAVARPVDMAADDVRQLSRDLIETMYANHGIGLAAPQIGSDLAVFVANPTRRRGQELVVVNPVVVAFHGRASAIEGCLSLPNAWHKVRRASHVHMSGQDPSGRPLSVAADGLLAVVLLHEFDHLQGRLFIDHLSWFTRRRVQRAAAAACPATNWR